MSFYINTEQISDVAVLQCAGRIVRAQALVKKFVSDKVQFFSTNSTIQSWGCVKRERVLNSGVQTKRGCYGSSELSIVVPRVP